MNKDYSVLISVYEKENPEWLRESIESMLRQSVPPAEIIMVKDGPLTKELEAVLADYQRQEKSLFHMVELPENRGLGLALQTGVAACRYDWIARMDTDDYACPDRVEKQLAAAEKHSADIVSCNVGEFQDNVERIISYKEVPETHEEIYRYAKRRNPFNHPGVLLKKTEALKAGNYRKCDGAEDYDLWVRMLQNGCRGYNVQEPLVRMRVNADAYKRRGGIPYLKSMLALNWNFYQSRWYSLSDLLVRSSANILVAVLPNAFRDRIYKKGLRKKEEKR